MKSYTYLCGMSRYVINTETSKAIKRATKKFGTIEVNNNRLRGVIEIVNYRKYQFREEVDIVFKGEIRVHVKVLPQWYDSETIRSMGETISKIKLNRFIKKSCTFEVVTRMKYFGCEIRNYRDIGKIQWV